MERNPHKRGDHQQQARDRQYIPEGLFHFQFPREEFSSSFNH
jgi:hypothetical protein